VAGLTAATAVISIPFPIVLLLGGALYWPVTPAIATVFTFDRAHVPRWWLRVVCFTLATVLAADCLLAFWTN
jgi:hypothetical protein